MTGHYIKKCAKCNAVIEQCRCPCGSKHVQYSICDKCKYIQHQIDQCEKEQQQKKQRGDDGK